MTRRKQEAIAELRSLAAAFFSKNYRDHRGEENPEEYAALDEHWTSVMEEGLLTADEAYSIVREIEEQCKCYNPGCPARTW